MTNVARGKEQVDCDHAKHTYHDENSQPWSHSSPCTDWAFRVRTDGSIHRYSSEHLLDKCTHENHALIEAFDVVLSCVLERENCEYKCTANHREQYESRTLPITIIWSRTHCDEDKSPQKEKDPVVLSCVTVVVHFFVERCEFVIGVQTNQLVFLVFLQLVVFDCHGLKTIIQAVSYFWFDI